MRTPTDIGADGAANLLAAVRVARDPAARGRGCLVVMNDTIWSAGSVSKGHTSAVQAFFSPNGGPVGHLVKGQPVFLGPPLPRPTIDLGERRGLEHVAVIYAHANLDGGLVDAAVAQGAAGIILAGVGNGNASKATLAALDRAVAKDVWVVRSSRVGAGHVSRNVEIDDDRRKFIAAGFFNPQQARVILALALTKTRDPQEIQKFFSPWTPPAAATKPATHGGASR